MTVIARTIPDLIKALQRQGFLLVADLPPVRPVHRRGMIVVRLP
jgi:hypothetical protein